MSIYANINVTRDIVRNDIPNFYSYSNERNKIDKKFYREKASKSNDIFITCVKILKGWFPKLEKMKMMVSILPSQN